MLWEISLKISIEKKRLPNGNHYFLSISTKHKSKLCIFTALSQITFKNFTQGIGTAHISTRHEELHRNTDTTCRIADKFFFPEIDRISPKFCWIFHDRDEIRVQHSPFSNLCTHIERILKRLHLPTTPKSESLNIALFICLYGNVQMWRISDRKFWLVLVFIYPALFSQRISLRIFVAAHDCSSKYQPNPRGLSNRSLGWNT